MLHEASSITKQEVGNPVQNPVHREPTAIRLSHKDNFSCLNASWLTVSGTRETTIIIVYRTLYHHMLTT